MIKKVEFPRCPVCDSEMKWYRKTLKSYLKESQQRDAVYPSYIGDCLNPDCCYTYRTEDQLIKSEEVKL